MKYNFLFLLSCSPLILSRRLFQRPYKNPIQYRNFHIPSSSIQTKLWRQQQLWYKNGKHNECELYQKPLIEKITQKKLEKSNERLHTQQYDMNEVNRPMKNIDGLEWTENFDGYIFDKALNVFVPIGVTRYYPYFGGRGNGSQQTDTSNNNGQNGNGTNGNGTNGNGNGSSGGNGNNTGGGNGQ